MSNRADFESVASLLKVTEHSDFLGVHVSNLFQPQNHLSMDATLFGCYQEPGITLTPGREHTSYVSDSAARRGGI